MPWWGWLLIGLAFGLGVIAGLVWFAHQFQKGMNW